MILADPHNPTALAYRETLIERLAADEIAPDVIIVIGGDGFMLHTIHEHGFDAVYLGLNAGRVGFILNDVDDWDAIASAIQQQRWTSFTFPLLDGEIVRQNGERTLVHALNDVYLERSSGQTAHLQLAIDGHSVVDHLAADGLCFATALGSTAYAFSAGGPACHPTLPIMNMAPICPHRPRLHPMVLPLGAEACVEILQGHRRPVRAVADGRSVEDVKSVRIQFAQTTVRLAYLEGHDFTGCLLRKILAP